MQAYFEEYVDWMRSQQRAKQTVVQYMQKVRAYLVWSAGKPIAVAELFDYRMYRQQEQRMKPATIRADFTAIYDFFEWLEMRGYAKDLPRRGSVKLPSIGKQNQPCPSDDEMRRIFAACESMPTHTALARYRKARTKALVAIFTYSGVRFSECLALRVSDIDRSRSPWRIVVVCGKGGQADYVDYAVEGEQPLLEWLAIRAEWCKSHGYTTDGLWPVDKRRGLCERGARTVWDELLSSAKISWRCTPHCLRRWFGSSTQELEGLATAQRQLRHLRPETTLKYLKSNSEKSKNAAKRLSVNITPEDQGGGESAPPKKPSKGQKTRPYRSSPRRKGGGSNGSR